MDTTSLKLERQDGVATLTLDRPGALNALDPTTLRALRAALRELDGDPGVRPEFHTFVASKAPWEELPDDGLPRYEEHYTGP